MDDERAVALYVDWRRERVSLPREPVTASYTKLDCAQSLLLADAFSVTAQQSLEDLANFVNLFVFNFRRIWALTNLLDDLNDDEQSDAVFEFGFPLVHHCLGAPSAIRGRFQHAIALVSNHANPALVPGWPDYGALPYSSKELARYMAQFWSSWPALQSALGTLNNRAYLRATRGFRNEYHHGAPANVAMGIRRTHAEDARGVHVYGVEAPLSMRHVVDALSPQADAAVAAHNRLVDLFHEQCGVMANNGIERTRSALD